MAGQAVNARQPRAGIRPYPLCIAEARACPPEDVGSTGGYEEFLRVLGDPSHEEHDHTLAWIGGFYDPEGFDANRINAALQRQRR